MSTPAGPAASGSSRPPANTSEPSVCPRRPTTSPGETLTAGRSTSPRSPACTASDSRSQASDPDRRTTMSAKLQPGMTLPDFELPDENGDLHRLSELQGDDPMILL